MADKEQCVREFSSFLSRTAREMEKVLCQLKWRKENLMKKVWIGAISGNMTSTFASIKLIEYMFNICTDLSVGFIELMFFFLILSY